MNAGCEIGIELRAYETFYYRRDCIIAGYGERDRKRQSEKKKERRYRKQSKKGHLQRSRKKRPCMQGEGQKRRPHD